MSAGHRHRTIHLARGSLRLRALQHHLIATTDGNRANHSRLIWGRLTPDEPDYPRRLTGRHPQPDAYVLTPLSILHTLAGVTVETDPRGRCPAPVHTAGGVLRCVVTRAGCTDPAHRRWDPLAPLLAVVWWLRPWWPNALGRAQDRGEAHTCPTVRPCRACQAHGCGDPTCTEAHP